MRLLLLLLASASAWAACSGSSPTRTAASASQSDVADCVTAATAGDTINVPSGSASWSGLTIAKALTLNGAGVGSTNITLTGNNTITKQSGGVIRVQNFSFSKSGGGNSSKGWTIGGAWADREPVIFQHNAFTISGTGLFLLDTIGGVIIADNAFTGTWDDSFIQPKNPDGSASWNTASTMGTDDTNGKLNHYVERNTFYGGTNQGIDVDDNTRTVYRYNELTYSSFNSHGQDTSASGVRHWEIYNNEFKFPSFGGSPGGGDVTNQSWFIWIRGGTGVIHNNTLANITSGWWGDKNEWDFSIRGAEDARPQGSCGSVSYPVPRQLGQSHNGSSYITDPIYIWSNTGPTAGQAGKWNWGNPCGLTFGDFYQSGRDYVLSSKSGYTPYTYPHPLTVEDEEEADPPTVTTTTATSITSTTASTGGNVTSDGGASVSARGVCYATTANPTTPCTSDGTGTGSFSSSLSGLTASTEYNYRAFATNSEGTSYGSNLTFTTDPPPDTTPPSRSAGAPSGTVEYGTTKTLSLTTNEAATCRWSASSGTAYASMTNTFSTTGGTSHSTSVDVSVGSNTFYVRCIDGASNPNTDDMTITFTVAAQATITSSSPGGAVMGGGSVF